MLAKDRNFFSGKLFCAYCVSVPVLFTMHTLFSLIVHTQCAHDFYCGTAYKLHSDFVFSKLTRKWCILQYLWQFYQDKKILLQPRINFLQRAEILALSLFIWMMFKGLCGYLKLQNTLEERMKQEMTLALTKG